MERERIDLPIYVRAKLCKRAHTATETNDKNGKMKYNEAIRNVQHKMNNPQLICNKTAVTIKCTDTMRWLLDLPNTTANRQHHQCSAEIKNSKENENLIKPKMKTYTKTFTKETIVPAHLGRFILLIPISFSILVHCFSFCIVLHILFFGAFVLLVGCASF